MNNYNQPEFDSAKLKRIIIPIIVGIIALIFISKSSITIKAGEAGVLFRTFGGGVETDRTYEEGFHIIAPWNKMVVYPTRQQEIMEKMGGAFFKWIGYKRRNFYVVSIG